MLPTITAFKSSPDKGHGQARDMRVRWALEAYVERGENRPAFRRAFAAQLAVFTASQKA